MDDTLTPFAATEVASGSGALPVVAPCEACDDADAVPSDSIVTSSVTDAKRRRAERRVDVPYHVPVWQPPMPSVFDEASVDGLGEASNASEELPVEIAFGEPPAHEFVGSSSGAQTKANTYRIEWIKVQMG